VFCAANCQPNNTDDSRMRLEEADTFLVIYDHENITISSAIFYSTRAILFPATGNSYFNSGAINVKISKKNAIFA